MNRFRDFPPVLWLCAAVLLVDILVLAFLVPDLVQRRGRMEQMIRRQKQEAAFLTGAVRRFKMDRSLKERYGALYRKLEARGIVGMPDRLAAVRTLEALQKEQEITGLSYTFSPARSRRVTEKDQIPAPFRQASLEKVRMVSTPVTLTFGALTDADVLSFLKALRQAFPGIVAPVSLDVQRRFPASEKTLRAVARGGGALVSAKFVFSWRTAILSTSGEGES